MSADCRLPHKTREAEFSLWKIKIFSNLGNMENWGVTGLSSGIEKGEDWLLKPIRGEFECFGDECLPPTAVRCNRPISSQVLYSFPLA
jgi:hypothetical protein